MTDGDWINFIPTFLRQISALLLQSAVALNLLMEVLALNHVGVRCRDVQAMENFYIGILGMKRHPSKHNWLSVGNTYAVHLMPPYRDAEEKLDVDPARHFAIQVVSLDAIVKLLLKAGMQPYQLALNTTKPHIVTSPDDDLSYGIGTIYVNDPDGNVVEFIDLTRGIFADVDHTVKGREIAH